ncbi:E3 Ubiquitin ligase family protein [Euphorbia peplus]|nr:E3 Ubiquitin ligase family protein [Euphorbia peplus]
MSSQEQALASVVSQLAFSFDGAVLGVVLAYAAVRSLLGFTSISKALGKIRKAPSVRVSDLRSVLDVPQPSDDNRRPNINGDERSSSSSQKFVIVRGHVEAKDAVDSNWRSLRPNVLIAHESGDKAVIVQATQTCIYNEWKGFFGWTSDIRAIFGRSWREQKSKTVRMIPFVLVDGGRWPSTDFLIVNMEGSKHPLPLTTVYHHLKPIDASPYTFLQALFGHEYPVGLLDEEKILPLGQEINVVGILSNDNGIHEIKSCKDLPYFLSDMTKDQMVVDLAFRSKLLLWSGIILGSVSIGILGYAFKRNWNRWKASRQRRQSQVQSQAIDDAEIARIADEDETGDVPDGQLCVICLMRRRRSAFVPCGHLVCCQLCSISVEREVSPKCPLCRQDVRTSIRIFEC